MIYPMVPFPVTLSDPWSRSQGHGVSIDALDVLCAQLTRDLFAIAKFLYAFASTAKKSCPCISTRATSVSGLTCWNSLLLQLKSASLTLQQFCDRLKTILFSRSYAWALPSWLFQLHWLDVVDQIRLRVTYIHTYIHTNAKIKVTLSQNCCRGTVQNYC